MIRNHRPKRQRNTAITLAGLLAAGLGYSPPAEAQEASARTEAAAVYAARQELAAKDLWPGFAPETIPLAVFDGEQTWLFDHPQPPAPFAAQDGREGVSRMPGRHPAVSANSSAEIGGQRVATLMPSVLRGDALTAASTAVHESFHVFQRAQHPSWMANEVEFFTYPDDKHDLLALRRLEGLALSRALEQSGTAAAACWTRTALDYRNQRFEQMGEGAVGYERNLELFEGLAQYLETRATGRPHPSKDGRFAADGIRWRVYWSGHALARLLDRLLVESTEGANEPDSANGDWRHSLQREDDQILDQLLAAAVEGMASDQRCQFGEEQIAKAKAQALSDVEALRAQRRTQREELLATATWQLILESPGSPLWPQGFDPLNLQNLGQGEVLHSRMLKLGNEQASLSVLNRSALTEAAGEHPLFQGVRRVIIAGLPEESIASVEIREEGESTHIRLGELELEAKGAKLLRQDQTLTVRLGNEPPSPTPEGEVDEQGPAG